MTHGTTTESFEDDEAVALAYTGWCRVFWSVAGVTIGYSGEVLNPSGELRRFGRWKVRLKLTERNGEPRVCVRCDEVSSDYGMRGGTALRGELVLFEDRYFRFDRDPKCAAQEVVREIRSYVSRDF